MAGTILHVSSFQEKNTNSVTFVFIRDLTLVKEAKIILWSRWTTFEASSIFEAPGTVSKIILRLKWIYLNKL